MINKLLEGRKVSCILVIGFFATAITAILSIRICGWFSCYQVVGMIATGIGWIYADHREQLDEMTPRERAFYEAWK